MALVSLGASAAAAEEQQAAKAGRIEQLRQSWDRKNATVEQLREEILHLKMDSVNMENEKKILKQKRFAYRVFSALDVEGRHTVSIDNFTACGCNSGGVKSKLFDRLPNTFVSDIETRDGVDFIPDALREELVAKTGLPADAISIWVPDEVYSSGDHPVQVMTRLAWHGPWDLEKTLDDDEKQAYFGAILGTDSASDVTPAQGRAKEGELKAQLEPCLQQLGYILNQGKAPLPEHRATLNDFFELYWFDEEDEKKPQELVRIFEEAKAEAASEILPEDVMDHITELTTELQKTKAAHGTLKKDTQKVHLDVANVDKEIQSVMKELADVKDKTGYERDRSKSKSVDVTLMAAQVSKLSQLITNLKDEAKQAQKALRAKTQMIHTLSKEKQEKEEHKEKMYQLTNDIKCVGKEVLDLQAEHKRLKGDEKKRDTALLAHKDSRDIAAKESMLSDHAFLKGQVNDHKDKRRDQEAVINTQRYRLDCLYARLKACEDAMKDLNITLPASKGELVVDDDQRDPYNLEEIQPAAEQVEVMLYELLCRDLSDIEHQSKMKQILITEKEATIEATKMKVEQYAMSNDQDEQYHASQLWKQHTEVTNLMQARDDKYVEQRAQQAQLKRNVQDASNKRWRKARENGKQAN